MEKKHIIIVSLIILVILLSFGAYFYLVNKPSGDLSVNEKDKMETIRDEVEKYLINKKGYEKGDILSLKSDFNSRFSGSDAAYSVIVIFKNEEDIQYRYGMSDGEVFQEGYSGTKDNPDHEE